MGRITRAELRQLWYIDSQLDVSANLAVIFCTKDASRPNQPLEPMIEIDLDLPDGRRLMKYGYVKPAEFEASKDGCDVRIGNYRFAGNLHKYTITGAAEDVSAEVRLGGRRSPGAWRRDTSSLAPVAKRSSPGRRSCPSAR